MDDASDAQILEALERLGSGAVASALASVTSQAPADDWDRNFLACAFGAPGALRKAVEAHANWFPDIGFPLWDSELLDIVAEVGNFGEDAFLLHWMHMEDPSRLATLSAVYLTKVSGKSVVWRLPPETVVHQGEPTLVRAMAVTFLRDNLDEATRRSIRESLQASELDVWAVEHHFPLGMSIRNALRGAGFTEASLGVDSLDEVWVGLLVEALSEGSG